MAKSLYIYCRPRANLIGNNGEMLLKNHVKAFKGRPHSFERSLDFRMVHQDNWSTYWYKSLLKGQLHRWRITFDKMYLSIYGRDPGRDDRKSPSKVRQSDDVAQVHT